MIVDTVNRTTPKTLPGRDASAPFAVTTPVDQAKQTPGISFTRADQLMADRHPPQYILERTYEKGLLYAVIGPPKSGKSAIVLDQAARIATGLAWHDLRTQAGAVFVLAGEGHSGINRRLRAWEILNEKSLAGAPLYVSDRAAALIDDQDAERVASELGRHRRPGTRLGGRSRYLCRQHGPAVRLLAKDVQEAVNITLEVSLIDAIGDIRRTSILGLAFYLALVRRGKDELGRDWCGWRSSRGHPGWGDTDLSCISDSR